jgi:thioredoxin 1
MAPSSPLLQFTDANFEQEVLRSDVPVLVDFFADWCGPCRMLSPIVEELARDYAGRIKIGKVDADANPEVCRAYGIMAIPTVILFKTGKTMDKVMGLESKGDLRRRLDKLLAA